MSEVTIRLDQVKKKLQDREVLKGVSFEVCKGDIFGFLGPNGAGKTTTIRTMMGLYYPDAGTVNVLGGSPDDKEIRQRVGFVLDRDGLYDSMTAEENLACFLDLYGHKYNQDAVMKALDAVDLKSRAQDKVGSFSKGMRQRVAIARAIVHDPEVIILDEPTSGVDPTEQINLRKYLVDIAKKGGKTIFLSTHNMDEVQKICNKIAVLNKGIIQVTGVLSEVQKQYGENSVTVTVNKELNEEQKNTLLGATKLGFQTQNGNRLIFQPDQSIKTGDIIKALSELNVDIEEIVANEMKLEDMYASIIKESESK